MRIDPQFLTLAAKIQESSLAMCHEDIRTRLSDAIRAANKDTDRWCYIVAVFGDDKAGDVVYSCNSDLKKAPYTMTTGGATIDVAKAVDVCPLTTYELETVQVGEAGARNSKRDLMQLQTIHDAAAGMGANCSMKESAKPNFTALQLIESAAGFTGLKVSEARTTYPIKIISPGTGSSAHYPKEVLKKAAEAGVFKAKTLMYWNHATAAEEAARPEGDLDRLAAITTTAGVWQDNGVHGPGIYAEAKVMGDYAQKVEERAANIGVSIRAGGKGTGKLIEGKPELASIDYVESIDYVTKAGRGGMALAEAAREVENIDLNEGATDMDAAEIKKLQESLAAQTAINERLVKRALRADAIELGNAVLGSTSLTESQRKFVVDMVLGSSDAPREIAVKEGGTIDITKLTEAFNAGAKSYAATLPAGRVTGMGPGATVPVQESAEQKTARESRDRDLLQQDLVTMMELGLEEKAAKTTLGIRLVA